ncbi:4Fe4S-binding leucine-rich repeat protein [Bradyrhizobium sp. CIAT3101]|uniref:4Fe4S-binding leucine-rich repeat protein n=1 Tax=Bradyrhizobium sp. CIAT3101 TaxID=439387 RepID=UPI0024B2584B|nr:4Fe4S-binding leucine-rich repeat protein [Bradyrhizobium sp. CIAT3101]WFU80404.1 4Fe4S-binding leucine-rich repeat protein [Bradyrhizobium sp. CIAT3101]
MSGDIDEARNWQDDPIDCTRCAHVDLKTSGRCQPKQACINDRHAQRIDRFFDSNPELADSYLAHPYFEVRAIAAKFASLFLLPPLLADEDGTVRSSAVRRLPGRDVLHLQNDPCDEVRMRVATRLEGDELLLMAPDKYYYVRLVVARRIAPSLLGGLIHDEEAEVRRVVARRIPEDWLLRMVDDRDASVRLTIAQRLSPQLLSLLRHDQDWRIRHEVASRIAPSELIGLIDDPYSLVRDVARSRLAVEAERGPRASA